MSFGRIVLVTPNPRLAREWLKLTLPSSGSRAWYVEVDLDFDYGRMCPFALSETSATSVVYAFKEVGEPYHGNG